LCDKIVVTAAAGDGAQFARPVEDLEDDTGVISEPANDREIDLHEIPQTAELHLPDEFFEFLTLTAAFEDFEDGRGE
jgi:hypothetical protein